MFAIYRKRKMISASVTSQQYIILHGFAKRKVMGGCEWSGDVVLVTMELTPQENNCSGHEISQGFGWFFKARSHSNTSAKHTHTHISVDSLPVSITVHVS
jgi:hypothetical protein